MALPNAVLFPHSLLPLHIFEAQYRKMLSYSLKGDRMFCVGLIKPGIDNVTQIADLCPIIGIGLIRACVENKDGASRLMLQGLARVRLINWMQDMPFKIGRIELMESILENPIEADALSEKVKELCNRIAELGRPVPPNLGEHLEQIDSPEILSDVVAAAFVANPFQRQQLLEAMDVCERLRLLILFLRGYANEE